MDPGFSEEGLRIELVELSPLKQLDYNMISFQLYRYALISITLHQKPFPILKLGVKATLLVPSKQPYTRKITLLFEFEILLPISLFPVTKFELPVTNSNFF